MARNEQHWGCELRNVLISRRKNNLNSFELSVPSLSLYPNELGSNKLPIMGVSGAGKSTLMNVIAAIEWPHASSGEIRWMFPDGESISWSSRGPTPNQLKRLRQRYFGFAFQSSTLIPHLTIEDNLIYPLEFCGYSRDRARVKSINFLEQVVHEDIATMLRQYPHELSGGEKQRVALIQSMVHDPTVLFADEPTGSLDLETRRYVMEVLIKWVETAPEARFLVWVTHHADDPREHRLDRRLSISGGVCHWQSWVDELAIWKNENADA